MGLKRSFSLLQVKLHKADKARASRLTVKAGPGTGCSRHTGGSRSFIEHAKALAAELGQEPEPHETFMRMHKTKEEKFVDERSKRFAEDWEREISAATQAEGSSEFPHVNMQKLYVDVAEDRRSNASTVSVRKRRHFCLPELALVLFTIHLLILM